MTTDDLINMIYQVPPETRRNSVFVCDPKTADELRKLTDGDGRYTWRDAPSKVDDPRVLGYLLYADERYAGLAFGPFPRLPEDPMSGFTGHMA